MKKRVILFSLFLLISFSFVMAQETECEEGDESCKLNKARSCLEGKIDDKTCGRLNSEERVFSLLAVGECKSEVQDDSKIMSDTKFTAQAILALKNSGSNVNAEKSWLLSKKRTSIGLSWFLEIESPEATECSVSYSGSNQVNFGEDKKISFLSGGSCLRSSQEGYWLEVSSECYDEEFTISCDKSFLTTLLYQKQGSDTIFVSELTHSATAEGTTNENVNSFCFTQGSSCSYEATLWSTLALSFLGEDVSSYLSYLTAMKENNENLFPESFLYYITGDVDFRNQLLSGQIGSKWWVASNDRFYGTALALFSLQFENPLQKQDSIEWLFNEAQDGDGCWDSGNIRNTAFILYSLDPQSFITDGGNGGNGDGGGSGEIHCENEGFSCISADETCSGNILDNYVCSNEGNICCEEEGVLGTCEEQIGNICRSYESCTGDSVTTASDLNLNEVCCLTGSCESDSGGLIGCEAAGYSCISQLNCAGNVLSGYSCSGAFVCCTQKYDPTCSEQSGEICNSNQNCVGVGSFASDSSDLSAGQICCISGTCQEPQVVSSSACETSGGICRINGCLDNEASTTASCDFSSDVCCIQQQAEQKTSYLWIWILGILIILVVLAIIFREKLRPYWIRIKSKFKRGSKSARDSKFPPMFPPSRSILRRPMRRPMRRMTAPSPSQRKPIPRRPTTKPKGEIDEVLKKLKEMSK